MSFCVEMISKDQCAEFVSGDDLKGSVQCSLSGFD